MTTFAILNSVEKTTARITKSLSLPNPPIYDEPNRASVGETDEEDQEDFDAVANAQIAHGDDQNDAIESEKAELGKELQGNDAVDMTRQEEEPQKSNIENVRKGDESENEQENDESDFLGDLVDQEIDKVESTAADQNESEGKDATEQEISMNFVEKEIAVDNESGLEPLEQETVVSSESEVKASVKGAETLADEPPISEETKNLEDNPFPGQDDNVQGPEDSSDHPSTPLPQDTGTQTELPTSPIVDPPNPVIHATRETQVNQER